MPRDIRLDEKESDRWRKVGDRFGDRGGDRFGDRGGDRGGDKDARGPPRPTEGAWRRGGGECFVQHCGKPVTIE